MFNVNKPKMMYPEPEATGSGTEARETTPVDNAVDTSLFSRALSQPLTEEQTPSEQPPESEPSDYQLDFEGVDFTDEEKGMFSSLGAKHGLDATALSGFTKDLKCQLDAAEENAKAELIKEWGPNAQGNVERISRFLQQVASARGWSPEFLQSFNSASVWRLMHDVVQHVGGNKPARGLTKPAAAAPARSKADLQIESAQVIADYYKAVEANDATAMRKFAKQHAEIIYQLTGKREQHLYAP